MNDRESLIELIMSANCVSGFAGSLADYLIANGVTFQKHGRWIAASDGTHFCSECGCDASYTWDDIDRFFINSADDVPDRISGSCPNCGAKMEGEADG